MTSTPNPVDEGMAPALPPGFVPYPVDALSAPADHDGAVVLTSGLRLEVGAGFQWINGQRHPHLRIVGYRRRAPVVDRIHAEFRAKARLSDWVKAQRSELDTGRYPYDDDAGPQLVDDVATVIGFVDLSDEPA